MSLKSQYLNSVKSENQKSNFSCQTARDIKDLKYQSNKSTSLILN